MTNQEVFDTAAEHVIRQGTPAIEFHACRYRTNDDSPLKCAVGALIPEADYNSDWEGMGILPSHVGEDNPLEAYLGEKRISLSLAAQLQKAHDQDVTAESLSRSIDEKAWRSTWISKMKATAALFDLELTQMNEELERHPDWIEVGPANAKAAS